MTAQFDPHRIIKKLAEDEWTCPSCVGTGNVEERAYPPGQAVTTCSDCGGKGGYIPMPASVAVENNCKEHYECDGCEAYIAKVEKGDDMSEQDNRDKVMPTIGRGWPQTHQRDATWQVHLQRTEALRQQLAEAQAMALEENELRSKEAAEFEGRLAEIRQRVIVDYYDGTSPEAGHWGACRLCEWIWPYGTAENHEPTCPMQDTPCLTSSP